jgi:hypothetical protein
MPLEGGGAVKHRRRVADAHTVSSPEPLPAEQRLLTIFSTCKPFSGHSAVIQENAIRSWTLLEPRPEIIVFGDEPGVAELCEELEIRQVPDVRRSETGAPYVSELFGRAEELATSRALCFVNADILLPQSIMALAAAVVGGFRRFLAVGRRLDLDVADPLDFNEPEWADKLAAQAAQHGRPRGDLCIDWMMFPRGLFGSIPDFVIGRTRYDNWLIWNASAAGAVVIDASAFNRVVHQNHDYAHARGNLAAWEGTEARRAEELLGHWSHYHSIAHARLRVAPDGSIVPARGARYLLARPRRVVAQALRFTRPWRRRLKLRFGTPSRTSNDAGPSSDRAVTDYPGRVDAVHSCLGTRGKTA